MGSLARYMGAVVLALLGVGIFPINKYQLTTPAGWFFGGLALALLFLAYRLWPSNRKATQIAPQPKRVLPQGWPVKDEAPVPQQSTVPAPQPSVHQGMPATPNMPDITVSEPVSVFMLGSRSVMFHKAPPTIGARSGLHVPVTYLFTGTVYDVGTRKTLAVYTLEASVLGSVMFCAFDHDGTRVNMGDGSLLNDLSTFEAAVVERACRAAGVPRETARRMSS